MQKPQSYLLVTLALLFLAGCGGEERKFEFTKTEVFPMLIDSASGQWEINIPVIVKGYSENRDGDSFVRKVMFEVDLVTPDGKTVPKVFEELDTATEDESKPDTKMDVQFYLQPADSGDYTAKITVTDQFNNKKITKDQKFKVK